MNVQITNADELDVVPISPDTVVVVFDSEVDVIQTSDQGPPGPPGPAGPPSIVAGPPGATGPRGNAMLYGVGNPTSNIGIDNDFYINTTTSFLFGPKVGGVWPAGASLIGPMGPQGNTVLYGAADPTSGQGIDGNFYINTTSHFMFGPKAGGLWPSGTSLIGIQGATGPKGADGNTVRYGSSNPTPADGVNGDFFINISTNFIFGPKSGSAWPTGVTMTGPQGIQGIPGNTVLYGSAAPVAGIGVDGNFYINTANNFIYGPKAAGAWPTGISLVGPQGPKGDQGIQGLPGSGAPGTATPIIDGVTAAVGTSVNFAREDHVHPSDAIARAVLFDRAQALTVAQQMQGRANVYAAPFDALAFNGMQVNGSTEISQERGEAFTTNSGSSICDSWRLYGGGTYACRVQSTTQAYFPGIRYYINLVIDTAQPSLGASDFIGISNFIEGYRVARLAMGSPSAMPFTIGFWAMHGITGLFSGTVRNWNSTRTYAFTYNQVAANTPEYHTVTIPGDTTGSWGVQSDIGMYISFCFAAGTGQQTAPNVWTAGNVWGATGQINGVATTAGVFRLTGLIVVPGTEAPHSDRAPHIMRPFEQELRLCQRYLEKSYTYPTPIGTAVGAGSNGILFAPGPNFGIVSVPYLVEKRAAPSVCFYAGNGAPNAFSYYNGSSWADIGGGSDPGGVAKTRFVQFNGYAAVMLNGFDFSADARL